MWKAIQHKIFNLATVSICRVETFCLNFQSFFYQNFPFIRCHLFNIIQSKYIFISYLGQVPSQDDGSELPKNPEKYGVFRGRSQIKFSLLPAIPRGTWKHPGIPRKPVSRDLPKYPKYLIFFRGFSGVRNPRISSECQRCWQQGTRSRKLSGLAGSRRGLHARTCTISSECQRCWQQGTRSRKLSGRLAGSGRGLHE